MMLCENIRRIRKERGLTQEALAEALGVTAASVSKWENGQAAPEISMLTALADYFEISVDTLLGHEIQAERKGKMLEEMNHLAREGRFEEAKALSDKLLHNYPNVYDAVDGAASLYYRISIATHDKAAMNTSMELVRRLFPLVKAEKDRLGLLNRLANHYELLEDWDMARKYFQEANVDGCNDRQLAYVRAKEKPDEEAIRQISKNFAASLYETILDVTQLKALWMEQGKPEKAKAAVDWALNALESCGPQMLRDYAPMAVLLHLVSLEWEETESHVRAMAQLVSGKTASDAEAFLIHTEKQPEMLASQELMSADGLKSILRQMGKEQLIPIVEEVLA